MEQATISIRTDAALKRDFERLCRDVGMNMTTAFNVFMKQSVRKNALCLSLEGDKYRLTEEEGGMTDLQFKSWLRLTILALEDIQEQDTPEKMRAKLAKLREQLEQDLRS